MDAVPYGTADDGCPPVPIPPAADAGVSSCLLEGRLTSDGRVLGTSLFDVDALRAVEYAMNGRGSILVCPADPFFPLSALVAAAVHVAAMARIRSASGRAAPSPLRVAVATTDYRLRGFYRGLAAHERRGVGGVPLRTIVPAATIGANGMLSVIDRDDGRWSTVFVDSVSAARRLGRLDLLVVDLPVPDPDEVTRIGVPTVVVARDPSIPVVADFARRMAAFGYDWAVQAGVVPGATAADCGAVRLTNRVGQQLRIVPVVAPEVTSDAGLFWDDLGPLLRLARRSAFVRKLITDAFALFHDLLGLAMPVSAYERLTGVVLDRRVEGLAYAARILADTELRDDWLPMIEAELAGLLKTLRAADQRRDERSVAYSTKAGALAPVVGEYLDDGKDVLVVTRTAALARTYREYLRERWPAVRTASLGELPDVRPADTAVLLGMAPTWGRWIYRCGIGHELAVLAYTPHAHSDGAPFGSLDAESRGGFGFDEAATVCEAARLQSVAAANLSVPAQRARACAAVLSGHPGDGCLSPAAGINGADTSGTTVSFRAPTPPEVPPGLWDGAGWTVSIEPGSSSTETDVPGPRASECAAGLRMTFTDGTWAWLHDDSPVWRWRRHGARTDQIEASRLTVGDDVVFIDGDAHKTLLAKVLEVASKIPELAAAGVWVQQWRAALARARTAHGGYTALARALAVLGCGVQAQTVRLWCVGETIGPDDPQDVRRLGELIGDPILRTRHREVWQAMRTLRHAHVQLGRRLAALTRSLGPAAGIGRLPADEILDETSGLTAADVETAVVLATVAHIEKVPAVPRLLAGRRRAPDDTADLIVISTPEEPQ